MAANFVRNVLVALFQLILRSFRSRCVSSGAAGFVARLALALLPSGSALGADGDFVWARGMGGTGSEDAKAIAVDATGNVYSTGFFSGTVEFDPGTTSTTLSSVGQSDIFVSKLDREGDIVWARGMGGLQGDGGYSIAVDDAGNVYTAGYFQGTVDFDPDAGTFNLTSAGLEDIFVQKLDIDGSFVWACRIGGTLFDFCYGIAVDSAGNVYATGSFRDTVDFDPGAGIFNLSSNGSDDIFVQKLDTDGNLLWAHSIGSTSYDVGYGIAVDGLGNVYTTGNFEGTVDFDPGVETLDLTSGGNASIFVQKFETNGEIAWARAMGGTSRGTGTAIAADDTGNVYTTGYFDETVDFDPGVAVLNLISSGMNDIFVQKLDSGGELVWARRMGGSSTELGLGIAVDDLGDVFTTGLFQGTVDFDPGPASDDRTSAGNYDIYVQKLSESGDHIWTHSIGSTGYDNGYGIATNSAGQVLVNGYFEATVDFDPGLGASELSSAGSHDIFVLKLDGPPDTTPPTVVDITPATAGPTNSDSVDFTVTFDEDVLGFDGVGDLVLAHSGTANTGATIAGGPTVYTVTITGLVGDGSFTLAVDTGSDVVDLSGNALATSLTSEAVVIDMMPPAFSLVVAVPSQAKEGESIAITFDSSEPTVGDPVVTVNGNPATRTAKASLTYSYTVLPSDPLGPATISISGTDNAGNVGTLASGSAFTVVAQAVPTQMPLASWPLFVGLGLAASAALRRRPGTRC